MFHLLPPLAGSSAPCFGEEAVKLDSDVQVSNSVKWWALGYGVWLVSVGATPHLQSKVLRRLQRALPNLILWMKWTGSWPA